MIHVKYCFLLAIIVQNRCFKLIFPKYFHRTSIQEIPPVLAVQQNTSVSIDGDSDNHNINDSGVLPNSFSIQVRNIRNDNVSSEDSVDERQETQGSSNDSESESSTSIPNATKPITNEEVVRRLALSYSRKNISLSGLRDMAQLARDMGYDIPKDPNTLLKTPRTKVGDKSFHHFSLPDGIIRKLKKGIIDPHNNVIEIQINIDGIPIFKTHSIEMWPILCRVISASDSEPFVVSIHAGHGKPKSAEDFLGPFLTEMMKLQSEGLHFEGVQFAVELRAVICDAPARQFVKAIKGHGGYGACERCTQTGFHIEEHNCRVFPILEKVVLRTDVSFRRQISKNHHTGKSPFLPLRIDMILSFPLDYMHLVLLGVFKRLILIWTGKWHKQKLKHKLGIRERQNIDEKLVQIRKSYPKEFHRKPTKIDHIKQWKAVELRSFLLYSGPVVLKGNLSKEKYEHFLYLHFAIRILASPLLCKKYSSLAKECLTYFVYQLGKIYGVYHLIYNVHSLIHLSDECDVHGPLDRFSAFPFENFLGKLKKMIRSPNRPFAQIVRRISELDYISTLDNKVSPSVYSSEKNTTLLKSVKSGTQSDSFYLCDNGLVIKINGVTDSHITGQIFVGLKSHYTKPMHSKSINIYKSRGLQQSSSVWSTSELQICAKCWVMPTDHGCYIVPIIHHDY
jgi:hypothetical protein